jgi:hypothetical protein
MHLIDYILILCTLACFPLVRITFLCSPKDLLHIHSEVDLLGAAKDQFLKSLDNYFISRWVPPAIFLIGSFLAYPWINWHVIDPTSILPNFVAFLALIATWKAVTEDIDLATGESLYVERLLMLISLGGTFFFPGFLIPLCFIGIHFMKGWEHHQVMLWRLLQVTLAYLLAVIALQLMLLGTTELTMLLKSSVPWFLYLCIIASHYAGAGLGKIKLGPSWYSWGWHNRLHYLAASAYMWGWLRNQPEDKRLFYINVLKTMERPLQFGSLCFECGWFLAGFSRAITIALCIIGMLFHASIFLSSGIFFWQSIAILAALTLALISLPSEIIVEIFNWQNGLLLIGILAVFPLRGKLWKVNSLAWWDTPYIGRVHWSVIGVSGKEYGLYNDFMSLHERFFGRYHSLFLVPERNFNVHLGEVPLLSMRDAIISTEGNELDLRLLQAHLGRVRY